jgi:hypothetical protein
MFDEDRNIEPQPLCGVCAQVGHSFPGFRYEAETYVADYRLYTTALDNAQVNSVASEPSPLGTPGDGLCAATEQLLDDGYWTDFLGNSCSWYRCGPHQSGPLVILSRSITRKTDTKIGHDPFLLAYTTPQTLLQLLILRHRRS